MQVCATKGAAAAGSWRPFLFPPGLVHLDNTATRCSVPAEAAIWPVVHTEDKQAKTAGLWFYYAGSCSDLGWELGRTLRARNRVHAAILLEQLLRGGSEAAATERVAEWLRARHPHWHTVHRVHVKGAR